MRTLHISVLDKKATYLSRDGDIVCGNSDYVIEFAFDAEWNGYTEKVARFIWNGQYKDVEFTGTSCAAPIITNASEVEVGVYAGELSTTTPAVIGCQKSILCKSVVPGTDTISILPGGLQHFDLVEMGVPSITTVLTTTAVDTALLRTALSGGAVQITFASMGETIKATVNGVYCEDSDTYQCVVHCYMNNSFVAFVILVTDEDIRTLIF